MIETSNVKRIQEKSKAVMIDCQFVSFDLLTYFNIDLKFMCKTVYCLIWSLSSNTQVELAWRSGSVIDCHATARGSIPSGNGLSKELQVLHKGQ